MTPADDRIRRVEAVGGPPPRSPAGRLVYAIGDVHGRYDLLAAMLAAIVADIAAQPDTADPLLIVCGNAIGRGPASADVLAALVWVARHAAVEMRCLRGRHETALLDFLDRPETLAAWRDLGADATLRCYGLDGDDEAPAALRDALLDRMPASHLALLRAMPAETTSGDYAFSTAAPRSGAADAAILVHGGGGADGRPDLGRDRIGIDTAAWRTGTLTAVRLDGRATMFLQTEDADSLPPPPRAEASDDPVTMRDVLQKLRPGY